MAGDTNNTQLARVSLRNSVCITSIRKTSVIRVEHRTYVINMMLVMCSRMKAEDLFLR